MYFVFVFKDFFFGDASGPPKFLRQPSKLASLKFGHTLLFIQIFTRRDHGAVMDTTSVPK